MSINFCTDVTTSTLKSLFRNQSIVKHWYSKSCEFQPKQKLRHLICFKQWTAKMVLEILTSAMNLKCRLGDSHNKGLNLLPSSKVMILQEVNEPLLIMAVSKAATLLGATDVNIVDNLVWGHDYHGRIFSDMADVIFVTTKTHMCIQRFANQSSVPVLCMKSRTHASIQSLATVMSIIEEFGTMQGLNLAYIGAPHPILNSYLLLCPMLGANIKFKCCCNKCPVSPLLLNASKEMTAKSATESKQCEHRDQALSKACVVIAGPTAAEEKVPEFTLTCEDISKNTKYDWIFYHTCPRGKEIDDDLFWHNSAKTFNAFQNMHYIAAALMINAIKDFKF